MSAAARYYQDNDDISILHGEFMCDYAVSKDARLLLDVGHDRLSADVGSGFENTDGSGSADHNEVRMGGHYTFMPSLWADASVGRAKVADKDDTFIHRLNIGSRPFDGLRLNLAETRDYVLISPRSASLGVKQNAALIEALWEPGFLYTIVAAGRYGDYSDGNERWEAVLAPRRSVLRSEDFNLDLGARGIMFGFGDDVNSGYYDPSLYEQYALTGFGYWKLSSGSGISIISAAGYYKDDAMNDFKFGWSADAEATFGAFGDWMFRVSGHTIENFRENGGGAFRANSASASLIRRF